MKFSKESLSSVWSMGYSLGTSGRTSGQQEISDELQVNRASAFNDRHEFPSSKPCIDKRHEVRVHAVNAHLVQLKTSKNFQIGSVSNKGDELVKHMSNLPVYLQRAENERSVQEKALNFGVLDWKRLENWKLNESMPAGSHRKSSSAGSDSLVVTGKPPKVCAMSSSQEKKLKIGTSKMKTENEDNLAPQNCAPKPQNMVNLSPKAKHSRRSYSGIPQISESRTLSNGDSVEPEKNRDSGSYFSQEPYYKELYPTRLSCSLPVNESSSSKSGRKQTHRRNSDFLPCHSQDDMLTLPTQTEAKRHSKKKPSLTSLDSFETSQKMDLDIAGQPALEGRHLSHNRKFSFSLGRLSISFTSKQTSVLPELSSENCTSHFMDSDTRDKANASGGGRSSPLRRLLNPLVRSKRIHSAKTSKPTTNSNENVSAKKHELSTSEALLHLMCKEGLPFFKFVANNGNDILAAAVKKLPTSGKGDGCLIYSFCKVSVIKKKTGGWVGQGSKEKCSGLGYNIIGMMKVSSSRALNPNSDCEDESVVRESVLYSVDLGQGDKQAPEFLPNRELAAIMVRNQTIKHNEGDIVVILPGAIHGLPHKGAPSSLIERWRSGGSCDCGGWDIGCKLRVLAGDGKNHENQDSISLFVQRGDHEKKPVFCLSPLKNGLYSVQYDASITLLETFSACVAILISQKLSHILKVPKQKKIISASSTTTIQGQGPARYVPSPPLSPVGRI
nr:uncharacterized protein LOC109182319 isoform X1 [Ipomoea batatas]